MSPYRRFGILVRLTIALAALSPCSTVASAEDGDPWSGPAFSLDPKAILSAASAARADESAEAIFMIDDEVFRFEADGTALYRRHAVYKTLLEKGVDNLNYVSCGYQPWRQDRPAIRARVIGPSGAAYILDQTTIADETAREGRDVYTDARVLTAPLPGMEKGSVVEYEIELRDRSPLLSAGEAYRCGFGYSVPVLSRSLTLDCDASIPLRYATRGPGSDRIAVKASTAAGRKTVRFSAAGLPAVLEIEEYIPSGEVPVACVDFSTAESWRAVAEAYAAVSEPVIAGASVGDYARDALKGTRAGDRKAEIEAVLDKVRRDIRYTGIDFGENAIVPHAPSDTLVRGYGDCKDQAVLLAAALRAVGIEARLALLYANLDSDILESLPGFGLFNHAIVYLPGEDAWIDPTADFFRSGDLPPPDLGRLALVIAPDAAGLSRTPSAAAGRSSYREVREFDLAESGPAAVVETTTAFGVIEAEYRSGYASSDPKSTREHLEKYVKDVYVAGELGEFSFSDVRDMNRPFTLSLKASRAERGSTDSSSSVAILQSGSLFNFLPGLLTAKPDERAAKRSFDVALPYYFVSEIEFRLIPPPGFKAAALPESGMRRLGPATLAATYALRSDGSVVALFRFDPVKTRFTPAEAEALRTAILEYFDEDAPRVAFELVGETLLSAGKYREALDEFRSLAALSPKKALHRIRISKALEAAGFGEAARKEAREAVKLEPSSAEAHARLAWTYVLGPFARAFEEGCDLSRASKEYAAAAELEPDELVYTVNQAVLAEYGENRVRYGRGARLEDALAIYEKVRKKLKGSEWENNPALDLLRLGRFKELKEETKTAPSSKQRKALFLCAVAAVDGAAAAQREAARVAAAADERREVLGLAASMLLTARRYPESADLLAAGARGGQGQTQTVALAEQLRKLVPIDAPDAPGDDPKLLLASLAKVAMGRGGAKDAILPFFAKSARASLATPESVRALSSGLSAISARVSGDAPPAEALADIIAGFGAVSIASSGPAIAVLLYYPAFPTYRPAVYYMKREDGALRIVDSGSSPIGVSREILALLREGATEEARAWFALLRDQGKKDPRFPSFAGSVVLEALGDPAGAGAEDMRLAASAGLSFSPSIGDSLLALPALLKSIDSARDPDIKAFAARYGAICLARAGAMKEASRVADRLAGLAPEDESSLSLRVRFLDGAGESARAEELIAKSLADKPDYPEWLRMAAEHDASGGRFAEAAKGYVDLIDKGLAKDADYNQAGWFTLFADEPDYGSLEGRGIVQRLIAGSEAEVHTLACVMAVSGRFVEAQEAFRRYLAFDGVDPRSPAVWIAFGLYAESFGLRETAIAAYRRTEAEGSVSKGHSCHDLATLRLRRMGAE